MGRTMPGAVSCSLSIAEFGIGVLTALIAMVMEDSVYE